MPPRAAPCSRRSTAMRPSTKSFKMVRYSAWLYFDGGKAKVTPTRWASRGSVGPSTQQSTAAAKPRPFRWSACNDRGNTHGHEDTASSILPHERPLPPRTDLWTAAVFLVLRRRDRRARLADADVQGAEGGNLHGTRPGARPLRPCHLPCSASGLRVRSVGRGALRSAGGSNEAAPKAPAICAWPSPPRSASSSASG